MKLKVTNYIELIDAVYKANFTPGTPVAIDLDGRDEDFVVRQPTSQFFGATAFPTITGDVTINGNGITIARSEDAPEFRLFAVDGKYSHRPNAKLTLNRVTLRNGRTSVDGGAALINDGKVILNGCTLQGNSATKGGAIYNGDGRSLVATDSVFIGNTGLLRGGAIYNSSYARLTLKDVTFTENRALRAPFVDVYIVNQFANPLTLEGAVNAVVSLNDTLIDKALLDTLGQLQPFSDTFQIVEDEIFEDEV